MNFKKRTYRFNDFVDSNPGQVGRSRRIVIIGLKLRHFVVHLSLDQVDHVPHKTIINLAGLLVGIRPFHKGEIINWVAFIFFRLEKK